MAGKDANVMVTNIGSKAMLEEKKLSSSKTFMDKFERVLFLFGVFCVSLVGCSDAITRVMLMYSSLKKDWTWEIFKKILFVMTTLPCLDQTIGILKALLCRIK
jgi:hypothetical protein